MAAIIIMASACKHRSIDPAYEAERRAIEDSLKNDSLKNEPIPEPALMTGEICFNKEAEITDSERVKYEFKQTPKQVSYMKIYNYSAAKPYGQKRTQLPLNYAKKIESSLQQEMPYITMVELSNGLYFSLFYDSIQASSIKRVTHILRVIEKNNPKWKITID